MTTVVSEITEVDYFDPDLIEEAPQSISSVLRAPFGSMEEVSPIISASIPATFLKCD